MNYSQIVDQQFYISHVMNVTNVTLCNVSKMLSLSPMVVTETSLVILLSPIGFVLNGFLIYSLIKSTIFSINLRVLMSNLSISALLFCFGHFIKHISVVVLMAIDPCFLVTTLYGCKLQETATIVPLLTTLYSLVAIGVDRLYATLCYNTYDQKKRIYISVVLVIAIWTVALASQLAQLPLIPRGFVPFCQNLLVMNSTGAIMALSFSIILETLCVMIFTTTTVLDRTKLTNVLINQAQHSLAARYQLSQNIDINKIMLPSAIIHLACFLPTTAFSMLIVLGWKMNMETKVKFVLATLILIHLFTIVYPLMTFYKNERLRQQLTKRLPWLRNVILKHTVKPNAPRINNYIDDTEKYFQFHENMWNVRN